MPALRSFRPRPAALIAGLALCGLALAVPGASFARFLSGETKLDLELLSRGVGIWKLATILLGALLIAFDGWRPRGEEQAPLLERGRVENEPLPMRWHAIALAVF